MKSATLFFLLAALASCYAVEQKDQWVKDDGALPFYTTPDFTPRWISRTDTGFSSVHRIAPFSFISQNGETITEKTVDGKIYVAGFFFTSCPGICKRLTTQMKMVQDSFRADPEVLLLSHSVTPVADSVPRLRQYADAFQVQAGKWFLLTGSQDSIYTLARRSYFADEDMGMQKSSNDFLHTENVLLIDRQRHIRGVYKGTSPADILNLIHDIRQLKTEK
jgi:protein SCO1/2